MQKAKVLYKFSASPCVLRLFLNLFTPVHGSGELGLDFGKGREIFLQNYQSSCGSHPVGLSYRWASLTPEAHVVPSCRTNGATLVAKAYCSLPLPLTCCSYRVAQQMAAQQSITPPLLLIDYNQYFKLTSNFNEKLNIYNLINIYAAGIRWWQMDMERRAAVC